MTRLRWIRLAQGAALGEVARAAGIDPRSLRRIEVGEVEPTRAVLARVYRALGLVAAADALELLADALMSEPDRSW